MRLERGRHFRAPTQFLPLAGARPVPGRSVLHLAERSQKTSNATLPFQPLRSGTDRAPGRPSSRGASDKWLTSFQVSRNQVPCRQEKRFQVAFARPNRRWVSSGMFKVCRSRALSTPPWVITTRSSPSCRSQLCEALDRAGGVLTGALASGDDMVRIPASEQPIIGRELSFDLGPGQALEQPEMPFAQARFEKERVAGLIRDDLSRLARSAEVAAVESAETTSGEPFGQGAGLAHAGLRERAVQMALVPVFPVPNRFAVTQHNETCGWHDGGNPSGNSARRPAAGFGPLGPTDGPRERDLAERGVHAASTGNRQRAWTVPTSQHLGG